MAVKKKLFPVFLLLTLNMFSLLILIPFRFKLQIKLNFMLF